MAELTVPRVDFSPLGELGEIYKKSQNEQGLKDAFSQGIGSDPQSLAALAQRVAPHNPQLAINLAQLSHSYTRQGTQDARQQGLDTFNQNMETERLRLSKNQDARAAKAADEEKTAIKEVANQDGTTSLVRVNTRGAEGPINTGIAPSQPNNPFSAGGKFNEGQGKAAGFTDRMLQSEGILSGVAPETGIGPPVPGVQNQGTDLTQSNLSRVPGVGNYLVSNERQKFEQAKRDFVNAQLRRESGAAISPSEFASADKQYFPVPGDKPAVIQQKAANRRAAIEALGREGGPSYKPKYNFDASGTVSAYGRPAPAPSSPSEPVPVVASGAQDAQGFRAPPKVGELRDGYRFKGGNPGDPASWAKAKDAAPTFGDRFNASFNGSGG